VTETLIRTGMRILLREEIPADVLVDGNALRDVADAFDDLSRPIEDRVERAAYER
jgi:hypothetical protein